MNESKRRKLAYPELYGTKECPGSGITYRSVSLAQWQLQNGRFTRTNAVYGKDGKLLAEPAQRVRVKAPDGGMVAVYRRPVGWRSGATP